MRSTESVIRHLTVVGHEIGPFGGMESQLAALVGDVLDRGIEVTAIGRRVDLPAHANLRVIHVSGPARPFPLAYLWFFVAGTIAVARNRRGPVYTLGAIVLNRVDVRKVPFCHAAWNRSPEKQSRASRQTRLYRVNAWASALLSRAAERVVYRPSRSSELVAMSSGGAADLDAYFPAMRPARVIPNSVDIERFAPDPYARSEVRSRLLIGEEELVCVFAGGDWQRKGLPAVIEAIARDPDWRLLVLGAGDRDAMRHLARRLGAEERVNFLGRVDDPERYLAAADALAMPSVYEPWGNAVLEACACALPVIVAPADGVKDFIEPGVTGLVVDPRQDAIGIALVSLKDPERRARLGAAARERAAIYSTAAVADRYVDLLFDSAVVAPSSSQITGVTA
ncbi:MAG: glycosyltransferase family 4 protein [Solirubrobacterales bacterium]